MTIEAQLKIKQKEIYKLAKSKNALMDSGMSAEQVWRGDGRKDYDKLSDEINELSQKMPKFEFKELFDIDKHNLHIKVGIIDLDEVSMFLVESEYSIRGEDTIRKFKKFIEIYPEFCYTSPYEGDITYFFSKNPTIIKIKNSIMLHRGACGEVKDCPKNILIIMDMD